MACWRGVAGNTRQQMHPSTGMAGPHDPMDKWPVRLVKAGVVCILVFLMAGGVFAGCALAETDVEAARALRAATKIGAVAGLLAGVLYLAFGGRSPKRWITVTGAALLDLASC